MKLLTSFPRADITATRRDAPPTVGTTQATDTWREENLGPSSQLRMTTHCGELELGCFKK